MVKELSTEILHNVEIDPKVKELIQTEPEKFTIVHCKLFTKYPTGARIWPSTALFFNLKDSAPLLHAYNISMYPEWTYYNVHNDYIRFTLMFEGLPKECKGFTLIEKIPEPGGFVSDYTKRNETDVYEVEIFS